MWWAVRIGSFCSKLRYFTDQNRPKVSMLPSWVIVLKLSKKMDFLQFCADLSQKPQCVKAIYIYRSEGFYYSYSENDTPYRGLSATVHEILAIKISKKSQNPNIRSNSLCYGGLFWTGFWFLQVNHTNAYYD